MTCVRDCSTHNATKNVEYTILFNELILIVVMYRPLNSIQREEGGDDLFRQRGFFDLLLPSSSSPRSKAFQILILRTLRAIPFHISIIF